MDSQEEDSQDIDNYYFHEQEVYDSYDQQMGNIIKYLNKQQEKLFLDDDGQIDTCLNLMIYFKWSDELLDKSGFFDNDQVKKELYAQGVISQYKITQQLGECQICLEKVQLYQFGCQHYFCIDCYQQFVINSLKYNNVPLIRCPQHLCNYKLPYQMIQLLNSDVKKYYKISLCKSFLQNNLNYVCCLGDGCEIIHKIEAGEKYIDCPYCYTSICILCKQYDHQPLNCDIAKRWDNINTYQEDLQQIIIQQFQMCQNCEQTADKLPECNHIQCLTGENFCYVCGKEQDGHIKFYWCELDLDNQSLQLKNNLQLVKDAEQEIQEHINKNTKLIDNLQEIIQKFSIIKINFNIKSIRQLTQQLIQSYQALKYSNILEQYYEMDNHNQMKAQTISQISYQQSRQQLKHTIDGIKSILYQLEQYLILLQTSQKEYEQIQFCNNICQLFNQFPNLCQKQKKARQRFIKSYDHDENCQNKKNLYYMEKNQLQRKRGKNKVGRFK